MTQIFEIEDELDQFYATLVAKNMTKIYKFNQNSDLFKYIIEKIGFNFVRNKKSSSADSMDLEGIIIDGKVHGRAKMGFRNSSH